MQLPFTSEQFFDLFVAYNEALWPAVVALWIASQRDRPSQPVENPDVRPSMSDDDLYGRHLDVGDAAVLEPLGGSGDLGSNRRSRYIPARGLWRRCVTNCRRCTGDLFGPRNHA